MNEFSGIARVAHSSAKLVRRTFSQAFAAFTTGARLIPLGDNGRLLKSLAAKSTDR